MTNSACRIILLVIFLATVPLIGQSVQEINIDAGEANSTLRQFSFQANINLIYNPEDVQGVQTNPVQGNFSAMEALERLLMGTNLAFDEDPGSGAFAIIPSSEKQGKEQGDSDKTGPSQQDVGEKSYFDRITGVIFGDPNSTRTRAFNQEDWVFELSPFHVDVATDTGYVATSTLTGSRLNTRLADSAASVSVFTEEFLTDTGFTDLQEVALYSVGIVNDTQDVVANPNINNFLGGAPVVRRIRVRGLGATKGINYFQSFIPDDAYRAQRYDESRGPNGILFGISEAGGILNTSTLRANTDKDSGRLRYSTGSFSRNRLEGRFNKVIIDDVLGITLAGLNQDNKGWRNYAQDNAKRLYGALIWKPTNRLTVQAIGETGNQFEVRLRPFSATDGFLAWYRNKNLLGLEAVSGSAGIDGNNPSSRLRAYGVPTTLTNRNNIRYVYVANTGSYFDAAGTWITGSYDDGRVAPNPGSLVPSGITANNPAKIINSDEFPYPARLNAGGPDMFRDTDFDMASLVVDYQITGDLYLNISYNYQSIALNNQFISGEEPELKGDPNRLLRHSEKPAFDPAETNPFLGGLYFDANWRRDDHFVTSKEARLALSYDFDLEDLENDWLRLLGRHRFAAGVNRRETSDTLVGHRWAFLGAPFNPHFDNSSNRIAIRHYIDEGNFSTYVVQPPPLQQTSMVDDEGVTRPVGYVNFSRGTRNARSDIEIDSLISVLQSYFWDNRLVTIFGYRKDEADNTAFGHVVDPLYGDTLTTDPNAPGYREDDPLSAGSKTAGVVLHALPTISFLANYATSIGLPEFRNVVLPNSGIAPPIEGEGMETGISFSMLEDRISGRLVYFETEEINRTTSGGITRIVRNPMRESMKALDDIYNLDPSLVRKPDGSPYSQSEWNREVAELSPEVNAVLQDNYSQGWELSLVSNLTSNWRLLLNASYTDRILRNYGRNFENFAGFRRNENGRLIQAVTVNGNETEALAVKRSVLAPDKAHNRILEIAENVVGFDATTIYTDSVDPFNGDPENSIAYRLWESMDELQLQIDQREKRWGLQPYKFNVFSAYDFREGLLDGFTLGGGFRYLSGMVIGEDPKGNEFRAPAESYVDLMLRYRQRFKKHSGTIDYQLNVYNLLDETDRIPVRYSVLSDDSTRLSRFAFPEPITIRFTVTYSF